MKLGVPKEIAPGETRVAATPETVKKLRAAGLQVADEINPGFSTADVALIIGANDVTNTAAKTQKSSPIYGMPILEVNKARHIFFVKRSMKPGYSGADNLLFYQDNCSLVFGDAKGVCEQMAAELKAAA